MDDEIQEKAQAPAPAPKRARRRRRCTVRVLPSGSVNVRVKGRRPDGRPYDRSETISQGTPAERTAQAERVKAALWRWAEEVEAGLVVEEESVTLADLVERFRRDGSLRLRPADRSAMAGPLRSWAGVDVREMTDARWRQWVELQREGKRRSAAYVRSCYSLARRVVGLAVERKVIARLPWSAPQRWLPPERETRTRRALEPSETRALLDAAAALDAAGRSSGALRLRLALAHHTGARPIEVCRWGPSSLVEAGGVVSLRWQAAKGNRTREVPLPPELVGELRAWWATLSTPAKRAGVFFPLRGARGRWRTRILIRGRYETGALFTPAESAALREATGIGDLTPYLVRHAGITDAAAELGLGAAEVMAFTGHTVMRTTGRYVAGRLDADRAALLARPRAALGTTARTTVLVEHAGGGSPSAPESAGIRPESPDHGNQVSAPDARTADTSSRGPVVVRADRARELAAMLGPLGESVRLAGGPESWARLQDWTAADPAEVATDLATMIGAGLVPPGDRGWVLRLEAVCAARANAAAGKEVQKAGTGARKAPCLRVVRGA